jgi:uroporphyrinogen-III synthase
MARVLITRPQPGARATAERLEALGHEVMVSPLFTTRSVEWAPPGELFDALMVTSANAMRLSGPLPDRWRGLPCYVVGKATAEAAGARGFTRLITGDGDAEGLVAQMRADGIGAALHLAGREHRAIAEPDIRIITRIVYAADPVESLDTGAAEALLSGNMDWALLYSARAARQFSALVDKIGLSRSRISLGVLSQHVADTAGPGWRATVIAPAPVEEQLFAACGLLCDKP